MKMRQRKEKAQYAAESKIRIIQPESTKQLLTVATVKKPMSATLVPPLTRLIKKTRPRLSPDLDHIYAAEQTINIEVPHHESVATDELIYARDLKGVKNSENPR